MADIEQHGILYRMGKIPDLSLAKYSSLGGGSIEEILEKHRGFLRQFSRKPFTGIHLIYAYNPCSPDGARLHIYVLIRETDGGANGALGNAHELMEASPIAPFFEGLKLVRSSADGGCESTALLPMQEIANFVAMPDEAGMAEGSLRVCSSITKATKFIVPTPPHPEARKGYYVQSEFTENEESRLYSMMKLLEAFDRPAVYRIDLYPSCHAEELRSDLPLNIIKSKRDGASLGRNYELEGIEKSYEKLLEKLDGSPLFNANIFAFSEDEETGRAILEAAASEAIKKGSCDISHFKGSFHPLSFLDSSRNGTLKDVGGRFVATEHREPVTHPGYYIVDENAMNFRHAYITTQFTLEEASAFFRLPVLEDGEFIQCPKETAPKFFDPADDDVKALYLGVDDNNQAVYFDEGLLKKHAFVSGVPGSGKTVTMCHIVTSLIRDGIPFMVLEPAKTEYRAILNNPEYAKKVCLFAPGGNTPFPLRVNPFEMPVGISVGHHINRLCQVFEGAFPLEGALPFLLDRAIESVYESKGWNSKMVRTGKEERGFPTLSDLYAQIQKELERESYDGEVGGNLKSAIHMRIGGLLRRELGDIFDVPISTIEPSDWLNISSIIELEALGASQSNFLTLLLCVLVRESLMAQPDYEGAVRHVMFIEEAHNLIGPEANVVTGEHADPKQAATAFISDMLREVRALGEGMVIADQLPSAIAPEVLKNTGLKVALRITSADDRELLGSMMMANPVQLEAMAVADPGRALVMYEGLQRPFSVKMTEWLHDPRVKGYIEDGAARKKAGAALRNSELRALIAMASGGDGWYRRIGLLTAWIDLCAVRTEVESFEKRVDDVLAAWVEAAGRAQERGPVLRSAASPFDAAEWMLDEADRAEAKREALLAGCFHHASQIGAEAELCAKKLDFKSLNWAPVIQEFEGGIPDFDAKRLVYLHGLDDARSNALWQIVAVYLRLLYVIRSRQDFANECLDGRGSYAFEQDSRAAKLEEIGLHLESNEDMQWEERDWLKLRDVLSRAQGKEGDHGK
ncbi:ATP-binding protein [Eggerthella sinensis]|uniref:ATP-binding protein n=1 Tax=Eggerthella sinensis TaxID=242230 RepID=UPI00266C8F52|nr:DUF87 domain-containing protein [Eggerthella sinensis]